MESMLAYNYFERPSAEELLESSPWVRNLFSFSVGPQEVVEMMQTKRTYIISTVK